MREVTDPNLLAQLNAPTGGGMEVTDPNILAQLNAPESAQPQERPQNQGFFEQQRQRGAEMANLDFAAEQPIEQGGITQPESQVRKLGQFAAGTTDALGDIASTGYHALMTDKGEERIKADLKKLSESPVGQAGIEALKKGGEWWGGYKDENPRTAGMIQAGFNIAGATPSFLGLKTAGTIFPNATP
jgi:hypothetical protein